MSIDRDAYDGDSSHADDLVVSIVSEAHIVGEEIVSTTEVTPDGRVIDVIEVDEVEIDVIEVDVVEINVVQGEGDGVAANDTRDDDDDAIPTQGALPLDVRTGDAGVDAAVGQLAALDELPVGEHAEVFTAVHRALQDALVDLDRN